MSESTTSGAAHKRRAAQPMTTLQRVIFPAPEQMDTVALYLSLIHI